MKEAFERERCIQDKGEMAGFEIVYDVECV